MLIEERRPCKTRKVKCDEARPICVNCQRQGETCDYSIRLNWEGRGKKKVEVTAGSGQINFSVGTISVAPGRPNSGDASITPTISQVDFQAASFGGRPQAVKADEPSLSRSDVT